MPAVKSNFKGGRCYGWYGWSYQSSFLYDKLDYNTVLVRISGEFADDRILLHSHKSGMCFAIRVSSIQPVFEHCGLVLGKVEAHFVLEKFDENNTEQWNWMQPESKVLRCSIEDDIPWKSKTYDRWYPNSLQSQRDRMILNCTAVHGESRCLIGNLEWMPEPFRECETDLLISNLQKCDDKSPRHSHPVCSRIVNFAEKKRLCEYSHSDIDGYMTSKPLRDIEDPNADILSTQLFASWTNGLD